MAPRRTTRGPAARLLAGLGALLSLTALLAGIPTALYLLAGNPLVNTAQLGDLFSAMARPDDGTVLTVVLVWVGWIGWATFAAAFLLELVSHIAGWRPRVIGLRWQQRVSAALIAAVASAVVAPVAASAQAAFAKPVPAVVVVHTPTAAGLDQALTVHATAASADRAGPRYIEHVAARTEALLDVAERYGVPPQAIAEATVGLRQPDGRTMQPGQSLIRAGWTVRIPVAGQTAPAAPAMHLAAATQQAPDTDEQLVYTVDRNDWLYYIAERYLGDGDRYPEIAALNPQYAGRHNTTHTLHFPDYIEGGWKIKLPAGAYDRGENRHSTGKAVALNPKPATDSPAQPVDPGAGTTPVVPSQSNTPTATPSALPSASPSIAASASPAVSAPASTEPSVPASPALSAAPTAAGGDPNLAHASDDAPSEAFLLTGGLAGATILATLFGAGLVLRRRRSQAHRPTGHRARVPREGRTDAMIVTASDLADVERIDLALRHLSTALADTPGLADPMALALADGEVNLLLAAPDPHQPAPWQADGATWTLPADAILNVNGDPVPPLPLLAAIGSRPGEHLLLDLERAGLTTLAGTAERTGDLLRYLASELACNVWSDDVEVILAGFDITEAEQLVEINPSRVKVSDNLVDTLTRLQRRITSARESLGHVGLTDTYAGRLADIAADAWMPQIVLAHPRGRADLEALAAFDALSAEGGRCAVAAVAALPPGQTLGRTILNISPAGAITIKLGTHQHTVAAASLPLAQLGPLAEAMRVARDHEPVPPAAETETWAQDTDAAGSLLLRSPIPDGDQDDAAAHRDEPDDHTDAEAELTDDTGQTDVGPRPKVYAADLGSKRVVTAVLRRRENEADPSLDADLAAWYDHVDLSRPRIGILGPVTISAGGQEPKERPRFLAEVIVYFAQRGGRGATGDQFAEAMWPDQVRKGSSLRTALSRARVWLGELGDGTTWLSEVAADRTYRIHDGYLLDWHLFRRLRSRAEQRGPAGGKDLKAALDLVRGAPLADAHTQHTNHTRPAYPWLAGSDINPSHLTAAVVDTASQYAMLALEHGDHATARWAIDKAWTADIDKDHDQPWRDLICVASAEGKNNELVAIVNELMSFRDAEVPEDLAPDTFQVINELVPFSPSPASPVRRP